MALDVLQSKSQIKAARKNLQKLGVSYTDSKLGSVIKRLGFSQKLSLGDAVKSWDVLKTIQFVEGHISKDAAILDIGCFCSEILLCLHDLGYIKLAGCDLNPDIANMPYSDDIDYRKENYLHTTFDNNFFDAITSISVLEHGFDGSAFLSEAARLIKPGGYLLTSFDYWPEKIDTGDTSFFGMSWTLFSKEEIFSLVEQAESFGFLPVGTLNFEASGRPIECAGFKYTFGWLALKKRA